MEPTAVIAILGSLAAHIFVEMGTRQLSRREDRG